MLETRNLTKSFGPIHVTKGVSLTDETRTILGVEVVEVTEQKLPMQIRFNVQVAPRAANSARMFSGFDFASRWPDPTFRMMQMSEWLKTGLPFAATEWGSHKAWPGALIHLTIPSLRLTTRNPA